MPITIKVPVAGEVVEDNPDAIVGGGFHGGAAVIFLDARRQKHREILGLGRGLKLHWSKDTRTYEAQELSCFRRPMRCRVTTADAWYANPDCERILYSRRLSDWTRTLVPPTRDCDPLGRLVAARTIEGEGVFNGLEYRYDAWGAVAELRERTDGEASEEYRELCGLATYEYEGPKVIGTGSTRHAIAHRPRYLRLRGPEGVFVASLYYDYGDPGTVASVLARPKREVVGLEPGEAASWAPAWRLEESYLGRSWWVKGVYEAKPEEPGPWLPELTEEVPGAYEGALDHKLPGSTRARCRNSRCSKRLRSGLPRAAREPSGPSTGGASHWLVTVFGWPRAAVPGKLCKDSGCRPERRAGELSGIARERAQRAIRALGPKARVCARAESRAGERRRRLP